MRTTEDRVAKMYFSKVQGSSVVTGWVGIVGTCIVVFNVANLLLIPARASCPETFRSFPQLWPVSYITMAHNHFHRHPCLLFIQNVSTLFQLYLFRFLSCDKSIASFKASSPDNAI